jgi:hypothetical protein
MARTFMGYYLSLITAKFSIPVARTTAALSVLVPFYEGIVVGETPHTLGEVFDSFAWPLVRKADHWVMVDGASPKHGRQDDLFTTVAPFVVDGSYIKARGEDGQPFEWHFVSGSVKDEPEPTVLVGRAQIVVPVATLRDAFAAVEKKLPKLLVKLGEPSSVTAVFDRLGWKTTRAKDGTLEVGRKPGDEKELCERDRRVLKILAPFVTPESFVEGREGGWRIVFVDGRLEDR